jgi:putative addiction module component (TIGR02574 family)
MSTHIEELQSKVLDLPAEERVRLLELLLASFEPRTEAEEAWIQEAMRRRNEVRQGKVNMVPGDEALTRVRARLA